ncbi:MAG TPA: lipopolysaccharide heptosyltransferase II [Candidatus Binatia bacterium]|nr:lipopolysaccharide heptosyltransferase II [Candidatus Binatia bacterium]
MVAAAAARGAIFAGRPAFEPLVLARLPGARYLTAARTRRLALARELRALEPGAALLLPDSFSSALVAALAGIPRRIGYGAEGRGFLLTVRVPRAGRARSAPRAAEYRVLGEAAGLSVPPGEPSLAAAEGERALGMARLEAAGIGDGPVLVLAPGAAYGPAKQWGPERFAAVGAHVARSRGAALAIVGAGGDAGPAGETARLAAAAGARVANLAGATSIPELVGILDAALAVVSNDSGVMHLAAALGRPTVGIFGSTSPVWTASAAPWATSLYAEYPCSPCFRRTCPIGYGCLRSIEAEQGTKAVERLLGKERE